MLRSLLALFRTATAVLLAASTLVAIGAADAQTILTAIDDKPLALPASATQWVNSPPLTAEMLAGKSMLLWFYEEQCPKCRGRWPGLIELSKRYEDKPIVFVAVNSGNVRPAVEQYVREVRLPWPVIVDSSREFEKAAGLRSPISLQNIHQVKFVAADGGLHQGSWSDLEQTIEQALAGARWKIDPATIAPAMRPAWRLIEFGNFAAAAPLIKKGLADARQQESAETLQAIGQKAVQTEWEAVRAAVTAGDRWQAYRTLERMTQRFSGLSLPDGQAALKKELASDDGVKKQLAALKQLETLKRGANVATPAARSRVVGQLERLIQSAPGTQAAEEATALLAQLRGV